MEGKESFMTSCVIMAVAADPNSIVTDATTTFEAVSVLVVLLVAFFLVVKVVGWVREGSDNRSEAEKWEEKDTLDNLK